jgi:DNA-binding beta-propeller fold protein YncE
MVEVDYRIVPGWEKRPPRITYNDATDVTVDEDDNVFVLTRAPARVIVFDRDGEYKASWGEGILSDRPHGITAGKDGTVYCVDQAAHVVRRLSRNGSQLSVIGQVGVPSDAGGDEAAPLIKRQLTINRGAPPFNNPTKLAIGLEGDLYVTDGYGNARVHRFSPDGQLLSSWGSPGTGPGQFHLPHYVCVSPDGRVFVADRENERIQIFTPEGEFLEAWDHLQRPAAMVVTPTGLVWVAELLWRRGDYSWTHGEIIEEVPSRLSLLDSTGHVLARFGTNGPPCSPGNFTTIHGLATDSAGSVYIAELTSMFSVGYSGDISDECHRIQKLERMRTTHAVG